MLRMSRLYSTHKTWNSRMAIAIFTHEVGCHEGEVTHFLQAIKTTTGNLRTLSLELVKTPAAGHLVKPIPSHCLIWKLKLVICKHQEHLITICKCCQRCHQPVFGQASHQ